MVFLCLGASRPVDAWAVEEPPRRALFCCLETLNHSQVARREGDGGDGGRVTGVETHGTRDETRHCLHGRAVECMCVFVAVRVYVCRYLGSRAVDGRGPKHRLVAFPYDNERK